MAKEEKPLEYERRIQDTKSLAQRITLAYQQHPNPMREWRRRFTWGAPALAAVASLPFLLGLGSGEKAFVNGSISRSHAIFEESCAQCHSQAFASVADAACQKCHDGPAHRANAAGTVRCAECHLEHRGKTVLAEVDDRHCTGCHGNLRAHGTNLKLQALEITAFRAGRHPEFSPPTRADQRPLRLNHAVHMPAQAKTIRGMKLPMACSDCHATDRRSPRGDLLPVNFEQHCRSCHKRELEFDVFQVLGAEAPPAPHTKDPQTIHAFVVQAYEKLLAERPEIVKQPLGRDLLPPPSAGAWLNVVVTQSEAFLFERKCRYCHEYEAARGEFPEVRKVNVIQGRYLASKVEGEPWFTRAEFSHRAHRAADCASCHRTARSSKETTDVLIPKMQDCLPCHGSTGTSQDRCAECHLYHDKSKELDKDRRPVEQLIGWLRF